MDNTNSKLCVLWTTADKDTARQMVFMYTKNAKLNGWFDDVQLIIWGTSATLIAQDAELKQYLSGMIATGVQVSACRACAERLGVDAELEAMGVEVDYIGGAFTQILKSDTKVLSV